jgi:molybdopterin/thiamine biosynthesis adenylyltransferase
MITLDLEPIYTLNTSYDQAKFFIVIGCGGTGGYFVPGLANMVRNANLIRKMEGLEPHRILLIDADDIELKNLQRQNFIVKDLDKNKAEVLASRYGNAFEIEIEFLNEYITNKEMLVDIIQSRSRCIPVIVDAVDNNKTRLFIHEAAKEISATRDIFVLSSGNEQFHGQVLCSFIPRLQFDKEHLLLENRKFRTPLLGEVYPEVLNGDDKLPTEMSCDEMAVSAPQNIAVNRRAAQYLFEFANILIYAKLSDEGDSLTGLSYYKVTFDVSKGTSHTAFNKKSEFEKYLPIFTKHKQAVEQTATVVEPTTEVVTQEAVTTESPF